MPRQRRFENLPQANPDAVLSLEDDHVAILTARPLFERSVVAVASDTNVFVSGQNNRKIGRVVTRGGWRGFPIFTLTLPERASCPASCVNFKTCYGNSMPFARRHEHGPELEARISVEIERLARTYPCGFVVRLHVLGDFYSVAYVRLWRDMLRKHSALHVYGYTARGDAVDAQSKAIAVALAGVKKEFGQRFAIRWSMSKSVTDGAIVIDRVPESANVPEGLVCPAEREATACCATCGLCWEAPDKTIVFMRHGMGSRKTDRVMNEVNKTDDTGIRAIRAIPSLKEIAGTIKTEEPVVAWVKPTDLYVDETYQRNLTRRSMALITKIVTGFSWSHYKPPIVAKDARSKILYVIDGQHTAIAAASHPALKKIPVLMVDAKEMTARARGFIAHNRDRVAMTNTQIHHSAVVAGDPEAVEIQSICERAGVTIVKNPPPNGFGPRDTMAIASVKGLLRTIGGSKTAKVLTVLAQANCAPIRAEQMRAVAKLLYSSEFEGELSAAELREAIAAVPHDQISLKARDLAASTSQQNWEALAVVYFQTVKRRRRSHPHVKLATNGHAEARA